uniref:Uncharacterized protein n=1 Tax=Arion vulgaris TaxID=1028688 RepID=A0A0B6XVI6_9EUPU
MKILKHIYIFKKKTGQNVKYKPPNNYTTDSMGVSLRLLSGVRSNHSVIARVRSKVLRSNSMLPIMASELENIPTSFFTETISCLLGISCCVTGYSNVSSNTGLRLSFKIFVRLLEELDLSGSKYILT